MTLGLHEEFLYQASSLAFRSVGEWAIVWGRRVQAPAPRFWLGRWAQGYLNLREGGPGHTWMIDPASIGTAFRLLHSAVDRDGTLGVPLRPLGRLLYAFDRLHVTLLDETLVDYLVQIYVFGEVRMP